VLTNDGDLAYKLTHPSFGVMKEYVVEVEGTLSRDELGRLRRGVLLDDGMTAPAKVSSLGPGSARVTIHEGRNRQVRRMCEAVGHPVRRLVRTRIGPVSAPDLASAEWRHLSAGEIRLLWRRPAAPAPPASVPGASPPDRPGAGREAFALARSRPSPCGSPSAVTIVACACQTPRSLPRLHLPPLGR